MHVHGGRPHVDIPDRANREEIQHIAARTYEHGQSTGYKKAKYKYEGKMRDMQYRYQMANYRRQQHEKMRMLSQLRQQYHALRQELAQIMQLFRHYTQQQQQQRQQQYLMAMQRQAFQQGAAYASQHQQRRPQPQAFPVAVPVMMPWAGRVPQININNFGGMAQNVNNFFGRVGNTINNFSNRIGHTFANFGQQVNRFGGRSPFMQAGMRSSPWGGGFRRF